MTPKLQDIRRQMTARFFVQKNQSGGKIYYDSLTKQDGLQAMHLIGAAIAMGADFNEAKSMVQMAQFQPIAPTPVYVPRASKVVQNHGIYNRNLWRPSEVTPDTEADAQPFVDHLLEVLGDQGKVAFVLDMLAWRYQNMTAEKKPHCAFYFYYSEGGHGKSVFLDTIEQVFGSSTVKSISTAKGLGSMSQVELWERSWFLIDEAKVPKGSATYDNLKANTGRDCVESDNKNQSFREYQIPALLMMMSNRAPQFIEQKDRRFFVSEWALKGLSAAERAAYFTRYCGWLKSGGYEAIGGLLATRKVSRNIYEDVPVTPEKAHAMGATSDPLVEAIQDWLGKNETYRIFHFNAFQELRKEYDTKASVLQHRLQEAGLYKQGRVRIGSAQPSVWLREGDKIIAQSNNSPSLVTGPFGSQPVNEAYYDPSRGEF